jgi:hypothetical protein
MKSKLWRAGGYIAFHKEFLCICLEKTNWSLLDVSEKVGIKYVHFRYLINKPPLYEKTVFKHLDTYKVMVENLKPHALNHAHRERMERFVACIDVTKDLIKYAETQKTAN